MTVNTFTDAELKAHNAAIRSAALAEAVKVLDAYSEYDRSLCCDGRECGCHGSSVFDVIKHYTLALSTTPPGMVCVERKKLLAFVHHYIKDTAPGSETRAMGDELRAMLNAGKE